MRLSVQKLQDITNEQLIKPSSSVFELPEKVVQFGTGVLLRGLPDYFIDKANREGRFNGRVVVVKSTGGDTSAFDEQDSLYTICIRGVVNRELIEQNIICSAISRVLSAEAEWDKVLACAANPAIGIVISNTTEVGIQLVEESIDARPPASFPAKLLAFLFERYKTLGSGAPGLVIIPTELITDNGKKLKEIVLRLAQFNRLDDDFMNWLETANHFCSSLVDCIVPGRPETQLYRHLETAFGYEDKLMIMTEVYRLWAIEGNETVKQALSFADQGVIVTEDITKYKELKLRLLNATHTLSCGLAYLSGIPTVRDAMADPVFSGFISELMLSEIAPAIPYELPEAEAREFGLQVLDRFRNPHIDHQWISITLQFSSKLAMRAIPVVLQYYKIFGHAPRWFTAGFAAYLLFMKAEKEENGQYFGKFRDKLYPINDDRAGYYHECWKNNSAEEVVRMVLKNEALWGTDLSRLDGFEQAVSSRLSGFMRDGVLKTISAER